jgi:hypothetical protein
MVADIRDVGNLVREERSVEPFDRVSLDGVGHADVHEGDGDHLVVEAPEHLMRHVETYVDRGTLVLRLHRPGFGARLSGESVHYEITMRNIRGLGIDGSGSIRAPRAAGESLDASIDGAGTIEIIDVDVRGLALGIDGCGRLSIERAKVDEVDCSIDGSGTISLGHVGARQVSVAIDGQGRLEAHGEAESVAVAIDGAGSVLVGDLRARTVRVSIDGVGKVVAWAEESLDARIDGYGRVEYAGTPSVVRQRVEGTGRVVRVANPEDVQQTTESARIVG